ncbi:uncharacterized protein ACHE_10645A [Aspergillus chevalieri]|uniref:Uncharacterized protein n=1 Tax=Aspergillus chevalieri TaxID=182096 RepID=A0A7R7VG84_ASPCH|nr:uncharacterized protein ACHE_10645A [Aspergillus chevalieri]BCR83243.1 hypothetical protein ACHE_10645A [Aspergillus chevalieri]
MSQHPYDSEDWPLPNTPRESILSSSTRSSRSSQFIPPLSPGTSSQGSGSRKTSYSLYDDVVRLTLNPSVTVTFVRHNKLFRLRYLYIDICKDGGGALKCLELNGGVGQQTAFVHSFHDTKLPVPHLEHPKLPHEPSLRVSFLDEQTVQTAHTVFTTQISYTFDDEQDAVQFQELILASKLVFIAGIAEAKSKGRGEECISQNLRILQDYNGKQVMLFFANSLRREAKRYVSIPVSCIESINPGKKAGKPVVLQLQPNFDLLSQMKVLQIQFLDDSDRIRFCEFLSAQKI